LFFYAFYLRAGLGVFGFERWVVKFSFCQSLKGVENSELINYYPHPKGSRKWTVVVLKIVAFTGGDKFIINLFNTNLKI